jgi:transcriptional regulator with XRE-family HTH domain
MSFSIEQLRDLRIERGLSQQALADALRVGRRTVIRWEHGEAEPTALGLAALEQWAAAGTNGSKKRGR